MPSPAARLALAAAALAGWLTHVVAMRATSGAPIADSLWVCHVAPLLLAIGCVLASSSLVSIATTWMLVGTPLWIGDLLATESLPSATPTLVHVGELAVALLATRVVPWDRHAWWRASLALAALVAITRLTPSAEHSNVNLAFRAWRDAEEVFPGHASFLAFVALALLVAFYAISRAMERLTPRSAPART